MSYFKFNCMTEANHAVRVANMQRRAEVLAARERQADRAARREVRDCKREKILNAALCVASVVGAIVATAVISAVFAC
jgi:hypothetical protein